MTTLNIAEVIDIIGYQSDKSNKVYDNLEFAC